MHQERAGRGDFGDSSAGGPPPLPNPLCNATESRWYTKNGRASGDFGDSSVGGSPPIPNPLLAVSCVLLRLAVLYGLTNRLTPRRSKVASASSSSAAARAAVAGPRTRPRTARACRA